MPFHQFLRENAPFLAVGVLLTFCSSFGQTFFISIFAGEIRDAFALSHGDWGLIYSAGTTASAVVMVWAGVLTDRFRVRTLGPAVLALLSAACLAMALAPGPWALAVAVFALRFAGQGMATLVAAVAMSRWFTATRGRALSVKSVGIAVGEAFLPLIFASALGWAPWRGLWVVAAAVPLLLLPLLWPLLRRERTPSEIAAGPQSRGMSGLSWTRAMMLRHPLFWLTVPSVLAPAAFGTAFFFHQVHLADTKGWGHVGLVALFPVYTGVSIAATFGSGFVIDRVGTARLMPLYQLPMALGFLGLSAAPSLWWAVPCLALMGLGQGANQTVPTAFWAEFYGTAHMGAIRALAAAVMVLGTALGPALTGLLIDSGVIFEDQMAAIALYFAAAAALVALGVGRAARALPRAA